MIVAGILVVGGTMGVIIVVVVMVFDRFGGERIVLPIPIDPSRVQQGRREPDRKETNRPTEDRIDMHGFVLPAVRGRPTSGPRKVSTPPQARQISTELAPRIRSRVKRAVAHGETNPNPTRR